MTTTTAHPESVRTEARATTTSTTTSAPAHWDSWEETAKSVSKRGILINQYYLSNFSYIKKIYFRWDLKAYLFSHWRKKYILFQKNIQMKIKMFLDLK